LDSLTQLLEQILQAHGVSSLISYHFFTSGTPVFALDQLAERLYPVAQISKVGESDAPSQS
jgi:hypothetical protein